MTAGAGISGVVNGVSYAAGSGSFIGDYVTEIPAELTEAARAAKAEGHTLIFVAREHNLVALLALGDAVRTKAVQTLDALRQLNLRVELLSGDHEQAVAHVAGQLGITEYRGHVTPEEKLAHVERLETSGVRVAMIGDGVNDAAALSRATIGISVAGAAEVARDAADVFIAQARGPEAVAELLELSRRAMRRIRWTLGIAVAYNLIGAGFAVTGHINPLIAAILMPISSLTVLLVATRK